MHYSFSELKQIDWDVLSRPYRDAAESSRTVAEFAAAISGMLAKLEDIHVWIELPDGKTRFPYTSTHRSNYDHAVVRRRLKSVQQLGRLGFSGRTKEGFGVVVIRQLPAKDGDLYRQLVQATQGMFGAAGVHHRSSCECGRLGDPAAQIAGLFVDRDYVYARAKVRAGPDRNGFRETPARHIAPSIPAPYVRPVICLVGPGCVSSGEGLALMMKALDHVTLIGQPTRGASGNPQPVTLPNGVKVWYSRWVSMEADGTPIEGRGVQPDIVVDHTAAGDVTFDRAVEMLRAKTGVGPADHRDGPTGERRNQQAADRDEGR